MSRGVPQAKICGLTRREDALAAARSGADYLGVVLAPGGRRSMSPDRAAAVLSGVGAPAVGVFVDQPVEEVERAAEVAGVRILQLHGDEPPRTCERLRGAGWLVWKAVRVRVAADLVDAAARYGRCVDALLLDAWSADAPGGTGLRFSWVEVAAARERLAPDLRLVVAGGLDCGCVPDAVETLRPDVVDVSSGVESAPGIKDAARIQAFITAVRSRRADLARTPS
jgi:phosphoribosylanthranilate isomerase